MIERIAGVGGGGIQSSMVIASATSSETSPWKIFLLGLLSFGTIVNTSVTTLLCRKEFIAQTARTQLKIALAFYSAQQR